MIDSSTAAKLSQSKCFTHQNLWPNLPKTTKKKLPSFDHFITHKLSHHKQKPSQVKKTKSKRRLCGNCRRMTI